MRWSPYLEAIRGLPCAVYHQLPAAYYLAARFHDDFESAVLHAINGGVQNLSRAILAGALTGAQTASQESPNASSMDWKMVGSCLIWRSGWRDRWWTDTAP